MINVRNEGQFHHVTSQGTSEILDLLKTCEKQKDLVKGSEVYAYVQKHRLLARNGCIAGALIRMYARCETLEKARQVLIELPVRNAVTWRALIAEYTYQGQGKEALKCFDSMQHEGHSPDVATFIYALKACGSIGALTKGKQIHDKILSLGVVDKCAVLGSSLVDMYAKCGALAKAQQVLNELPVRDAVAWTVLIAGYVRDRRGEEALNCFDSMQSEGHCPDAVTFICALKACGSIGAADKGRQIHYKIVSEGMLEKEIVLGNILVDMYARCGALAKAQQVLSKLPLRNAVTWNALISGYVQSGQGEQALKCFDGMQHEGHLPDAVTFMCALKACGSIGAIAKGGQIHDKLIGLGILGKDAMLGSAIIDMYARCGALPKAQHVLDELPARDVVTWNTLIAGYAQKGQGEGALKCFDDMQREGYPPDAVTFTCALKACGSLRASARGEQIHDKIVSMGMLEKDIVLGSSLVDMYAKCGAPARAQQVLNDLPVRNVVTWNALIAGYAQQGQGEEVLRCFHNIQRDGHFPDEVSFISALKACGNIGAAAEGGKIHEKIVQLGLLEKDIVLGSTLVDMYARCGLLTKAHEVLHKLPVRSVVTWNALISGYTQEGQCEEALNCFDTMQCEGTLPDGVTFICALKACGSIGASAMGEKIHGKIVSLGMLQNDVVLGNTLVDMYIKCAALIKAVEVFEGLPVQLVATWNAIIAGHGQWGQCGEALKFFGRMKGRSVKPNSTTLVCVLSACSHSGLLNQAEMQFLGMSTKYGITPDEKHCACMIDLFARAWNFSKVLAMIEKMPSADYLPTWDALLGACREWREVKIGRLAFEHSCQLDKRCTAPYICMTNIYTAACMQEDVDKIEMMRMTNEASTAWVVDAH